jgi:hypothetical protein
MAKPVLTPLMKKLLSGYLVIFTLLVGTLVGLRLVDQSQDIRQQASTTNVDLSLNAPASVTRGQTFNVDVIVTRTNNHPVSAADIRLNLPATHFTINSITPGPFFNRRTAMQVAPPGTDPAIRFPNITESNRIALGAMCDYCFLGPTPLPTYQPPAPTPTLRACSSYSVSNPACYPQTAGGLILATYSVTVRNDAPTGTVTLAFDTTNTQVASINSDVNVVGDMTSRSLSIATTATPTPTTGAITACNADINQDGTVTSTDYTILRNNYLQSPPSYPRADINGDGTVTSTDYTILRNFYLQTCNN